MKNLVGASKPENDKPVGGILGALRKASGEHDQKKNLAQAYKLEAQNRIRNDKLKQEAEKKKEAQTPIVKKSSSQSKPDMAIKQEKPMTPQAPPVGAKGANIASSPAAKKVQASEPIKKEPAQRPLTAAQQAN